MRFARSTLLTIALALSISASPAAAEPPKEVPASPVKSAYFSFGSPKADPKAVWAENTLREFSLWELDDVIARNLNWVRKSDWEAEFKDMFERAVTWVREVKSMRPEEIFRLSYELRARPDAEPKRFERLAERLITIAANRGYAKAKAEYAARPKRRSLRRRHWPPNMRAHMREELRQGDAGAMYQMAALYEFSEDLESDLAKAYYWLLRLRARGGDEAAAAVAIGGLDRRISRADKERALKWFREGTVPDW